MLRDVVGSHSNRRKVVHKDIVAHSLAFFWGPVFNIPAHAGIFASTNIEPVPQAGSILFCLVVAVVDFFGCQFISL